jgi:biotin operon repressor
VTPTERRIYHIIADAQPNVVSGQEIADSVGCTIFTLYAHLRNIRAQGLPIQSIYGHGYFIGEAKPPRKQGTDGSHFRASRRGQRDRLLEALRKYHPELA